MCRSTLAQPRFAGVKREHGHFKSALLYCDFADIICSSHFPLWLVHTADTTRQDSFVSSRPSFDERVGGVNKPLVVHLNVVVEKCQFIHIQINAILVRRELCYSNCFTGQRVACKHGIHVRTIAAVCPSVRLSHSCTEPIVELFSLLISVDLVQNST